MKVSLPICGTVAIKLFTCLLASTWLAWPMPALAAGLGGRDIQFKESAPSSSNAELTRRFRMTPTSAAYDIAKEKFRIVVPDNDPAVTNCGLFIWVSPSNSPKIAHDLEGVLARHNLIFIGAYRSGNDRDAFDRFRLAIDASFNVRQRFNIDPKRVYVAGFSGGGRVSSMLAVAYSDIFTGAIPICGVNFYTDIPAGEGQYYRRSYIPATKETLLARKNSRFALITGEKDVNRENTKAVHEYGFKKYGFAHVLYLEVPQMSHSNPPAEWLEKAVQFLGAMN